MTVHSMFRTACALLCAVLPALGQPSSSTVADLHDFRTVEVRSAGFMLAREARVHINALGGGDKSFFQRWFDDGEEGPALFAGGWIINAETRQPVWEMTFANTAGSADRRRCDDDVTLPKGSYELYFSAHGYERRSMLSNSSINIDRRPHAKRSQRMSGVVLDGGDDHYDRMVDEFMRKAQDYGVTLSVRPEDASSVSTFAAPAAVEHAVLEADRLGDKALIRKTLTVGRDVTLRVSAIGEGRGRDELFDHGWIIRADSRERVWEMTARNTRRAGGASKNRRYDGDLTLTKGTYELMFVTDDSHSNDDWNARPPYDPYRYGIILSARSESDRAAVAVSDPSSTAEKSFIELTKVGNNDLVSGGFSLKNDAKLHVYGIGEWDGAREAADYGWIVDARSRKRVWSMTVRNSYHAGGASKNRMTDEIITLPKGDYIAYYQTDGSHAYGDWNDDPPYDEEHWGLTISGAGERFDANSVTVSSEEPEHDVIAQITKARDGKRITKNFSLTATKKVRIYAIGEGQNREMFDYGWIERAGTGEVVWEMTYGMTSRAGGAKKNRMVDEVITLDKGEYELHYETDGSHAFNDWNDDPPEDPSHWGISLYVEK